MEKSSDVGTPFGCATVDYPGAEKDEGPSVVRPRKEAPKERLRDIRSEGLDVNLVGNGPETQSHYLRTGRAADLGYVHIHHQKP